MAKKSKIKKSRRAFDRSSFFPKREVQEIGLKYYLISKVFPERTQQLEYIRVLIKGLDEEPILENSEIC